ncbi:putative protease [Acetitomaculum ruminis DSM 5522]|uniref:Putative protease n=1 Tax=Acetitomaculum ruminis DSM 5522 TaxID=1120918 RepID=A0A1I0VJF7_9FIRM|nr:U32 family peptidase [Acetitomaculum ruminis]SFA76050.1 putative protease [Acetitomaculum ruminis DSM 5522]
MKNNNELLSPAGSFETLKAVANAGADAVYAGGSLFGARAFAGNLSRDEVLSAIEYLHIRNKKLYLTVNTLLKNDEVEKDLYDYLYDYYCAGLDAIIVQDVGVFEFAKKYFPELPLHASTQMTLTGLDGARLLKEYGAARIVTSRELSLKEISEIHKNVDIEIESFIHGALCYSYSGQCLFSSMLGKRSGNRGRCAQPCRLQYTPVLNDKKAQSSYILSMRDYNTLSILPQILDSGAMSLKIEGRMKRLEYSCAVTSIYRKYLDIYNDGVLEYKIDPKDEKFLSDIGNRCGFTNKYYFGKNDPDMITKIKPAYDSADEPFFKAIKEKYTVESKEKINGFIKINKGFPVTITIEYKDKNYEYISDIIPSEAIKQPLTVENVIKPIIKTGDYPFVFDSLEVNIENGLFLTVGNLKEIRRNALEMLLDKINGNFKRTLEKSNESKQIINAKNIMGNPDFYVKVSNLEQFKKVITFDLVKGIYISEYFLRFNKQSLSDIVKACHTNSKKFFYEMPDIFRKEVRDYYEKNLTNILSEDIDGFLVKNFDSLNYLKTHLSNDSDYIIICDDRLYAFNNYSDIFYKERNLVITRPAELTFKELSKLDNSGCQYRIYGHQILMVSQMCVNKDAFKCNKKYEKLDLSDRKNKKFKVMCNCFECNNLIYNSVATVLTDYLPEIKNLGFQYLKIDFTFESAKEVLKILNYISNKYDKTTDLKDEEIFKDFTRGHYKRGVE